MPKMQALKTVRQKKRCHVRWKTGKMGMESVKHYFVLLLSQRTYIFKEGTFGRYPVLFQPVTNNLSLEWKDFKLIQSILLDNCIKRP